MSPIDDFNRRFVLEQNLLRYRRMLAEAGDEQRRRVLEGLLCDAERDLKDIGHGLDDTGCPDAGGS